jgi:S1-C subfamily serine protease
MGFHMKKVFPLFVVSALFLSVLACSFGPGSITINPRGTPIVISPGNPQDNQQSPGGDNVQPTIGPDLNLPTPQPGDFIQPTMAPTPALPPTGNQQVEDNLVTLYKRINPGVVLIQVVSSQGGGLGSGFVVDKNGFIVTNFHVVEGATEVEVDFPSGFKAMGKVIGTDLDSDIAVIQVQAPAEQLVPLTLGDSDQIQVGTPVIAIGNPYGLSSSMTQGIISARGRTLESMRQAESGQNFTAGDILQTDAPINPGNSGGPLLDMRGEVIGINRAIRTAGTTTTGDPVNTGIGFAVPINMVKRVLPTLMKGETYNYPYLGLSSIDDLSLTARKALGLNRMTGAYVTDITSGGPADKAGVRGGTQQTSIQGLLAGGDLVIAVDGQTVNVFGDLLTYLMENKSPGDKVTLTIVRDGQEREVTITLGKRP